MVHLLNRGEVGLHALDGHVVAVFQGLSLEHFRKRAFSLLAD